MLNSFKRAASPRGCRSLLLESDVRRDYMLAGNEIRLKIAAESEAPKGSLRENLRRASAQPASEGAEIERHGAQRCTCLIL